MIHVSLLVSASWNAQRSRDLIEWEATSKSIQTNLSFQIRNIPQNIFLWTLLNILNIILRIITCNL